MSREAAESTDSQDQIVLAEKLPIDCRLNPPAGRPGADSRGAGTPTRFVAVDDVCPRPPARRFRVESADPHLEPGDPVTQEISAVSRSII